MVPYIYVMARWWHKIARQNMAEIYDLSIVKKMVISPEWSTTLPTMLKQMFRGYMGMQIWIFIDWFYHFSDVKTNSNSSLIYPFQRTQFSNWFGFWTYQTNYKRFTSSLLWVKVETSLLYDVLQLTNHGPLCNNSDIWLKGRSVPSGYRLDSQYIFRRYKSRNILEMGITENILW